MNQDIFIDLKQKKAEFMSSFNINANTNIPDSVFRDYDTDSIKRMYSMYMDTNFNYELDLKSGDKIIGKIVGETKTDYLFDIGYRDYLTVEKKKLETDVLYQYATDENSVNPNTEIELLIVDVSDSPYRIVGSMAALHKNDVYSDLLNNTDIALNAVVTKAVAGGYTIEIDYDGYKIPAFMPNILAGANKLTPKQAQEIVSKQIVVMIESFSSEKETFIASRKKYLLSLIPEAIENLQTVDDSGQPILYTGMVTGTTKFGVFVEFNECLTGMIHKDNMDEKLFANFTQTEAGSEITFYVKEIIKNKLILTQVWKATAWDTIKKDNEYEGVVCEEKAFGMLVRIDEETVGLIQSSELTKMSKKPVIGQTVKVKAIFVQKMERRIYFTLVK